MSAYNVVWTTTKPDAELDYRCDLCGSPANSIHFVPYVTECEVVLFACPEHDPGGYPIALADYFADQWASVCHIRDKGRGGRDAIYMLMGRIAALRVIR